MKNKIKVHFSDCKSETMWVGISNPDQRSSSRFAIWTYIAADLQSAIRIRYIFFVVLIIGLNSCKVENLPIRTVTNSLPSKYVTNGDTTKAETIAWKNYFTDNNLTELIDEALKNNQELHMMFREIEITRNEIMARTGEYKPFLNFGAGLGLERAGRYTLNGVGEEDLKIREEKTPHFWGDQIAMANFSWEMDPWKKLHNAKDAAAKRYLAGIEGRNFVVTNLIAEIANSYYELIVLDNQLETVQQNIALQKDALEIVKIQKEAGRVNLLAVNRFMAQVLNTENLKFEILQQITLTENRINFLAARYPQPIRRNSANMNAIQFLKISDGIPSQLLANRPDIRQVEQELEAAKLDIAVARANFYPNITLRAGLGLQSFNPIYLINPKSIAINMLGDLVGPLINKNAIRANYYNANEKQIQLVYRYEQVVLNAYLEVMNQLSGNKNYAESYVTKANQVDILNNSIAISNDLFKSARADYTEVLFTQREALEAKMELMEIKQKQLNAQVNIYKALGGGWK